LKHLVLLLGNLHLDVSLPNLHKFVLEGKQTHDVCVDDRMVDIVNTLVVLFQIVYLIYCVLLLLLRQQYPLMQVRVLLFELC
jgi:hypothetical protein